MKSAKHGKRSFAVFRARSTQRERRRGSQIFRRSARGETMTQTSSRFRACGAALLLCVGACTGQIGEAEKGGVTLTDAMGNPIGPGGPGTQRPSSNPDCVANPGPECATDKKPEVGAMNTVTTNVPDLSVISKCGSTTPRGADRESLRRL